MAFKGTTYRLAGWLALLVTAVALGTYAALEAWYGLLALALPVAAGALWAIFRLFSQNVRKLTFLFDSIANGDYSFKFTEYDGAAADNLLNRALNRIRDMLAAEKANISRMEAYYKLILDSVSTGILVVDDRGSVYQSNREAHRLLGLQVLTHLGQLADTDPALPALFKGLQPSEHTQAAFNTETGTVNLSLRASEVAAQGRNLRIIALNEIGGELDEREIDSWIKLTRVLTHEIMNSITPITSLADTMLEMDLPAGKTAEELRRGLKTIQATGNGLSAFVESYRRFTRIPQPQKRLFYVKPLLERVASLNTTPRTAVTVTADPADMILHADENLIYQVLTNLTANALHAVSGVPAPSITLSARVDAQDNVTIEVADNGPGIPEEVKPHIFIPFFTTKEQGSGLGLSISRQIMRLHGGTLSYTAAPGKTRFILTFK